MSVELLAAILLGGLGGAVASFGLQALREARVSERRTGALARLVEHEILQAVAFGVSVWDGAHGNPDEVPRNIRRDAFDRVSADFLAAIDGRFATQVLSFYFLHQDAIDSADRIVRGQASPSDKAWFGDIWLVEAMLTARVVGHSTVSWWTRLVRRTEHKLVMESLRKHETNRKLFAKLNPREYSSKATSSAARLAHDLSTPEVNGDPLD